MHLSNIIPPSAAALLACLMLASCAAEQRSERIIGVRATLPPDSDPNDGREEVLIEITVQDASGNMIAAPRLLTYIGQPAMAEIGANLREGFTGMRIEVTSRREGSSIVVDTKVIELDGHSKSMTVQARAAE